MSLEENLIALVAAVEANTDAQLQVAAALRVLAGNPANVAAGKPPAGANAIDSATQRRPPGRTPKAAPPAPADLAQQGQQAGNGDANTLTSGTGTPDSAPAAGNGSDPNGPDVAAAYSQLSEIVGTFAAKHGKTKARTMFSELGFESGVDLRSKAPHRIGEAITKFRAAL